MAADINVLALVKKVERYVFLFDDDHRDETLRTLGRFATNPDLSFTWYDAAVLSQKVRQTASVEKTDELATQLPAKQERLAFLAQKRFPL